MTPVTPYILNKVILSLKSFLVSIESFGNALYFDDLLQHEAL